MKLVGWLVQASRTSCSSEDRAVCVSYYTVQVTVY